MDETALVGAGPAVADDDVPAGESVTAAAAAATAVARLELLAPVGGAAVVVATLAPLEDAAVPSTAAAPEAATTLELDKRSRSADLRL